MVCPPPQNQNEVTKPLRSHRYPLPHFLGTLGAFSRHLNLCPATDGIGRTTALNVLMLPARSIRPGSDSDRADVVTSIGCTLYSMRRLLCVTTCERGAANASNDSPCVLPGLELVPEWLPWRKWFPTSFVGFFSKKKKVPRPSGFLFKALANCPLSNCVFLLQYVNIEQIEVNSLLYREKPFFYLGENIYT